MDKDKTFQIFRSYSIHIAITDFCKMHTKAECKSANLFEKLRSKLRKKNKIMSMESSDEDEIPKRWNNIGKQNCQLKFIEIG